MIWAFCKLQCAEQIIVNLSFFALSISPVRFLDLLEVRSPSLKNVIFFGGFCCFGSWRFQLGLLYFFPICSFGEGAAAISAGLLSLFWQLTHHLSWCSFPTSVFLHNPSCSSFAECGGKNFHLLHSTADVGESALESVDGMDGCACAFFLVSLCAQLPASCVWVLVNWHCVLASSIFSLLKVALCLPLL